MAYSDWSEPVTGAYDAMVSLIFEPLFTDRTYLGLAVELGEIENRVLGYFEDLHTRADRILEIIGAESS